MANFERKGKEMNIIGYIKNLLGFPQPASHPRGIGDGPGMLPYSQYEAAILAMEAHEAKKQGRRPRTAEEMGALPR